MRKQTNLLVLSFLLLSFGTSANGKDWTIISSEEHESLSLEFKIIDSPNASDQDWLCLEIRNKTGQPLPVEEANYQIAFEVTDGTTGEIIKSQSFSSRNVSEFLDYPKDLVLPSSPYLIKQHPSSFGSAILGVPTQGAYQVSASIHLWLKPQGQEPIYWEELTFQFEWKKPSEQELSLVRKQLQTLLNQPEEHSYHRHLLNTLINTPQIAQGIPLETLMKAKEKRYGSSDGKDVVLQYIGKAYGKHAKVTGHYLKQLEAGNITALHELANTPEIWASSFSPPLLALFEKYKSTGIRYHILKVFYGHQEELGKEERYKLFNQLKSDYADVWNSPPNQMTKTQLKSAVPVINMVALTKHKDAMTLICPFLDIHTNILDCNLVSNYGETPRPERMCDIALEASWILQGDDVASRYEREGIDNSDLESAAIVRDALINIQSEACE